MPSAHDPIVAVPVNGVVNGTTNGTNGDSHSRPHTPMTGMALTEYSANPSTPSEEKRARIKEIVPDEYLLPTGYPDVSITPSQLVPIAKLTGSVPSSYRQRHIASLRGLQGHSPHTRYQPQQPTRMQCPPQA